MACYSRSWTLTCAGWLMEKMHWPTAWAAELEMAIWQEFRGQTMTWDFTSKNSARSLVSVGEVRYCSGEAKGLLVPR